MCYMNRPGGYESLLVYRLASIIFYLNSTFCKRYLRGRTREQAEQAGRSGKQNIVEASLEKSLKGNIFLTGVSRGSFGELLEDYKDFLLLKGLRIWDKNDPRVLRIRAIREPNWSNLTNKSNWIINWTNRTYKSYLPDPEAFANLMLTLISKENYLLDQMLRSLEKKFVEEGGYTENLFKKRLEYKRKLDK